MSPEMHPNMEWALKRAILFLAKPHQRQEMFDRYVELSKAAGHLDPWSDEASAEVGILMKDRERFPPLPNKPKEA